MQAESTLKQRLRDECEEGIHASASDVKDKTLTDKLEVDGNRRAFPSISRTSPDNSEGDIGPEIDGAKGYISTKEQSPSKRNSDGESKQCEGEELHVEVEIAPGTSAVEDGKTPAIYCVPCTSSLPTVSIPTVQDQVKKRKLSDWELFSKPNRHVYNGYCPCCD